MIKVSDMKIFTATPHKDCVQIAQSICHGRIGWVIKSAARPMLRSVCQKSICLRGRPLLQGVPSFKTVHRTVLKFTPCGALLRQGISPSAEGDKGALPPLTPTAFGQRLAKLLFRHSADISVGYNVALYISSASFFISSI